MGRFREADADEAVRQYSSFIGKVAVKCPAEFKSFSTSTGRVDCLLHMHMATNSSCSTLWTVVKQVLLLSHGQATVECGFSINRNVEVENIAGETVIARRIVCDYVSAVGGIWNVDVNSTQLLISCSAAQQKYLAYLEDNRRKQQTQESGRK